MITASWDISLNCKCPFCITHVDLTEYESWDYHIIQPAEEKEIEATCPECGSEFLVQTVY